MQVTSNAYGQQLKNSQSILESKMKTNFTYVTIDELKRENFPDLYFVRIADRTFHGEKYKFSKLVDGVSIVRDFFIKGAQEWNRRSEFDPYHFEKQIILNKNNLNPSKQ